MLDPDSRDRAALPLSTAGPAEPLWALTEYSVVCGKQPLINHREGFVMSKLLTTLLAAVFAATTLTPVAFAADTAEPKKEMKKGEGKKKAAPKKKGEGTKKATPKKKGEGTKKAEPK
jgi:hypothetical protein